MLRWQSAIFNFQALLIVMLLTICTCAYLRANIPSVIDRNKTGSAAHPARVHTRSQRIPNALRLLPPHVRVPSLPCPPLPLPVLSRADVRAAAEQRIGPVLEGGADRGAVITIRIGVLRGNGDQRLVLHMTYQAARGRCGRPHPQQALARLIARRREPTHLHHGSTTGHLAYVSRLGMELSEQAHNRAPLVLSFNGGHVLRGL